MVTSAIKVQEIWPPTGHPNFSRQSEEVNLNSKQQQQPRNGPTRVTTNSLAVVEESVTSNLRSFVETLW